MTARGLGLVSLLVALALVGALWAMDARKNGPTSQNAQRVETQAQQAAAAVNFAGAATQLEAYRAGYGTYVGAAVQHYVGPGGTPAAGPC